jgi:metallo-beta-lactamase family protein
VVESTYGDRAREPEPPEARRDELARIILETCPAGGNLIIPGFAVGRTQDLLHDILMLLDEQRIPGTQVWVDSPLAVAVSQVFLRFPGDYDGDARELLVGRQNLFDSPWFHFTQSQEQSMALNDVTGSIIISASGMCDAGRIKHHLRHNVYKPANTILFVGYQAEGTLGRRMVDGARQITIHGRTLAVRAKIEQIRGYSGHADQGQLMAWLGAIHKLRSTLFVVHGEDAARQALAELAREQLGFSTRIPSLGEAYDLLAPQEPERVAHARSAPAFAPPPPAQAPREDPYPRFLLDLASALRRAETEEARRTLFDRLHDALRSS